MRRVRELTAEGQRIVAEVAARHGVSQETVVALLVALAAGRGTQAQFNIPELGGMGQWSRGGMTMVGDMFNNALKARVDALCTELSGFVADNVAPFVSSQSQSQGHGSIDAAGVSLFVAGPRDGAWWPGGLGQPASVGAQNDLRYAVFPEARRLVVDRGGAVTVYDTGDHRIGGAGQQQGADRTLSFTSQLGLVRLDELPVVDGKVGEEAAPAGRDEPRPPPAQEPEASAAPVARDEPPPAAAREKGETPAPAVREAARDSDDVFHKLERLAELRDKGVLSDSEFAEKKAELLARL